MTLPHRFPFRLVDRADGRRALLAWTADAYWARGAVAAGVTLLVEAVAQGAALLLAGDGPAATGQLYLAGIEDALLTTEPGPGDTVTIEVRLVARLGGVVRVRGEIRRSGEPCGGATLVLASGGNG